MYINYVANKKVTLEYLSKMYTIAFTNWNSFKQFGI